MYSRNYVNNILRVAKQKKLSNLIFNFQLKIIT